MISAGSPAQVSNFSDSRQAYSLYMHPACAEILREIESEVAEDGEIPDGAVSEYLDYIGFEGTPEEYLKAMEES